MTEIKKATIRLIWLGHSNMSIVDELAHRFDILESEQNGMYKILADIRKEIADFREKAPELAKKCFAAGDDWRTVIGKFEEVGLIPSIEFVGICRNALAKVQAEQAAQ